MEIFVRPKLKNRKRALVPKLIALYTNARFFNKIDAL